jgi:hypothetical protein
VGVNCKCVLPAIGIVLAGLSALFFHLSAQFLTVLRLYTAFYVHIPNSHVLLRSALFRCAPIGIVVGVNWKCELLAIGMGTAQLRAPAIGIQPYRAFK